MNTIIARTFALLFLTATALPAQVPQLINYQGRVAVGAVNFDGAGQFKFALVDAAGTTTYWSNDGTSTAGSEPAAAVTLTVTKGLYTVLLGDATLPNMTGIPNAVFNNADVRLRIWFHDGANGSQLLTPDQRIAAVGYAMMAASVPDGAITGAKLASGAAAANLNASGQGGVASGALVLSANENAALVNAGYVRIGATAVGDAWQRRTGGSPPGPRAWHSAVWTGTEMIVWGGHNGSTFVNTGGRFNPVTGTWTPVNPAGAPAARYTHTVVWTGSEMIIWGGQGSGLFNDGGRYHPVTDSWTPLSTTGAAAGRYAHTAVWTGTEMIVWGGFGAAGWLNTGGRYNPAANTWAPTPANVSGAPSARTQHTAVWTGSEMIIWGGVDSGNVREDGGRYNPALNAWTPVPAGLPGRRMHTAVWTGSEMIVWGGYRGLPYHPFYDDGGRYNPEGNTWKWLPLSGGSTLFAEHTAVWTGSEILLWGGKVSDAHSGNFLSYNAGARFIPSTDTWKPMSTTPPPDPRTGHSAVWTGSEMIIFGGTSVPPQTAIFFNDTYAYAAPRVMHLYQRP